MSVRKLLSAKRDEGGTTILYTTAVILAAHAVALTAYPALHGLVSSEELNAAAWLLWFAAVVIMMSLVTEKS